jgi:hypothetical protein
LKSETKSRKFIKTQTYANRVEANARACYLTRKGIGVHMFGLAVAIVGAGIILNTSGMYFGKATTVALLCIWLILKSVEYSAMKNVHPHKSVLFPLDIEAFSVIYLIGSFLVILGAAVYYSVIIPTPIGYSNFSEYLFPIRPLYLISFVLMSLYMGRKIKARENHNRTNPMSSEILNRLIANQSEAAQMGRAKTEQSLSESFELAKDFVNKNLQLVLLGFAWFVILIALQDNDFEGNSTAKVYLVSLLTVVTLLPLVKSIKLFDFIEISRDFKQFKEEVGERLNHINMLLSSVISIQQTTQSTRINNVNQVINDYAPLINILNQLTNAVQDKLNLKNADIVEVQEQNFPPPSNSHERLLSIFRLRFLIEERLRKLADSRGLEIPATNDILMVAQRLRERELLDDTLLKSIDKIVRIVDDLSRLNFELPSQITEEILQNGSKVLTALDKIKTSNQEPGESLINNPLLRR